MDISGTYPMLYAFFEADGALSRAGFARQISACLASGTAGIAVLGLGTEVSKLGRGERRQAVEWVIAEVAGRVPVAVTIADGNVPDMIEAGRHAKAAGASWLILQPPRPPASAADLIAFFGAVADRVDLPIAIQNAPEFLGIGLAPEDLLALNAAHPNVSVVKAEASALSVAATIVALGGKLKVFNGRAGLELTDNYRAGVDGMIPGVETIDLQVQIERAMRAGNEAEAEALYRLLLPVIAFAMQGLGTFLCYGKLVAALRLGLPESRYRAPADRPTEAGRAWAARYATELGPLP